MFDTLTMQRLNSKKLLSDFIHTNSTLAVRVNHQYLLHLPIVEVVEVPDSSLGPLYEINQNVGRTLARDERVLQQLGRGRPVGRVLLQAGFHEEAEAVRPFRCLVHGSQYYYKSDLQQLLTTAIDSFGVVL